MSSKYVPIHLRSKKEDEKKLKEPDVSSQTEFPTLGGTRAVATKSSMNFTRMLDESARKAEEEERLRKALERDSVRTLERLGWGVLKLGCMKELSERLYEQEKAKSDEEVYRSVWKLVKKRKLEDDEEVEEGDTVEEASETESVITAEEDEAQVE